MGAPNISLMARTRRLVHLFNPIARWALGTGLPAGPDGLLTVRGRKTGLPRTVPVAVVDVDGRRWVIGAYGEVDWVRNLRAAGEGVIKLGKRSDHVSAVELNSDQSVAFFRDVLNPYINRQPRFLRSFVNMLLHDVNDPVKAAGRYPVFELHAKAG